MIKTIKVAVLRGCPSEDNRQKTLKAVLKFQLAQANLERVCKEQDIPVPEMVC